MIYRSTTYATKRHCRLDLIVLLSVTQYSVFVARLVVLRIESLLFAFIVLFLNF